MATIRPLAIMATKEEQAAWAKQDREEREKNRSIQRAALEVTDKKELRKLERRWVNECMYGEWGKTFTLDDEALFDLDAALVRTVRIFAAKEFLLAHDDLLRRHMAVLGIKGGMSTSKAKKAASRANGAKGGRPKKQK